MEALFSSLLAMPAVRISIFVVLGILALLYVLSIIWVARDSYLRGAPWALWTLVAIIPLVGLIAYCMLRPSLYQIDRDEQELEIAMKKRELMKYGECAHCGYPVEADYVICPNCLTKLKNLCPTCGHALDSSWKVCPYCSTTVVETGSALAARTGGSGQVVQMAYDDVDEVDDIDEAFTDIPAGSHAR